MFFRRFSTNKLMINTRLGHGNIDLFLNSGYNVRVIKKQMV